MDPNLPANPNPPQPPSEPQIFAGVTPSSGLLNGENTKINTGVIEAVNPQVSQQMLSQAKHPAPIPVDNNLPQTNQPFFEAPQQVPTVRNPNQADLYPMQYEPIPAEQRTAPIFPTTPSAIPTVANSTPEQAVIAVTPQELPQSATQALDPVETEEQHERFEQKKSLLKSSELSIQL